MIQTSSERTPVSRLRPFGTDSAPAVCGKPVSSGVSVFSLIPKARRKLPLASSRSPVSRWYKPREWSAWTTCRWFEPSTLPWLPAPAQTFQSPLPTALPPLPSAQDSARYTRAVLAARLDLPAPRPATLSRSRLLAFLGDTNMDHNIGAIGRPLSQPRLDRPIASDSLRPLTRPSYESALAPSPRPRGQATCPKAAIPRKW